MGRQEFGVDWFYIRHHPSAEMEIADVCAARTARWRDRSGRTIVTEEM